MSATTDGEDGELFDRLLGTPVSHLVPRFQPIVGYQYRDGTIQKYAPVTWWLSLDRAVSSCFGSLAKRMGMTCLHHEKPKVALLMVVDAASSIVWRLKVDLPDNGRS